MRYAEFQTLIKAGEARHIDRKLECHAFEPRHPDSAKAKAELAKDICAMANNGSQASYLLIGVSDKGGHLKPVTNNELTDDNVQSFCKEAISPPPRVKLHEFLRKNSSGAKEKFVAVQVGPNPRHAYRLNRDFIDHKNSDERKRFFFRRNEVWIRRGATSDLAAPEEIVRLARGDKAFEVEDNSGNVVDFSRLEIPDQLPAILAEAEKFFRDIGCIVERPEPESPVGGFRVAIPLGRKRVVFRCVVRQSITAAIPMIRTVQHEWEYEHGMFIILMKQISERAFPYKTSLNLKERWGSFSKIVVGQWNFHYLRRGTHWRHVINEKDLFPKNFLQTNVCIFTLTKCSSSVRLRERLAEAHAFLRSDAKARSVVEETSHTVNTGLQKCLAEGWIQSAGSQLVIGERKLVEGEFKDRRWPNEVLVSRRNAYLVKSASSVLRLSAAPKRAKPRTRQ